MQPAARSLFSATHYPSWGSGTSVVGQIQPGFHISLPLMGIGNAANSRKPPSSAASLPLMGIGNLLEWSIVPIPADKLITPHGDRELEEHHPRAHRGEHPNYPSWGSGTRRLAGGLPVFPTQLIAPHGDRELGVPGQERADGTGKLITPHGDRELRIKATAGGDPQLIIPHGDRERTRRQSSGPRLPSHYPSWGSGTGFVHCAYRHILNSLPLMGIGNELIHVRVRDKLLLITPHGDREPGLKCCLSRTGMNSLPLMGIGNPPRP